jgi:hypothetical protein
VNDAVQAYGVVDISIALKHLPFEIHEHDILRAQRRKRRPEVIDEHSLTVNRHAQMTRVSHAQPVPIEQARRATNVESYRIVIHDFRSLSFEDPRGSVKSFDVNLRR